LHALRTGVSPFRVQSNLFSSRGFNAVIDMGGAIPGKHLCLIGPVMALHRLDLFGTPLFRSRAEFGRDGIWVNELLGDARSGEQQRRNKNHLEK
jgi:hypothetical protein